MHSKRRTGGGESAGKAWGPWTRVSQHRSGASQNTILGAFVTTGCVSGTEFPQNRNEKPVLHRETPARGSRLRPTPVRP